MAGKNHVAIKSKWHIGLRLNSELQFWLYECITQNVLGDTAGLGRELGLLLPVLIMLHVLTWRTLICQASWCIYSSQAHVCFRGPITYQQWFSAKAAGYWAVLFIYLFIYCEHNHNLSIHICVLDNLVSAILLLCTLKDKGPVFSSNNNAARIWKHELEFNYGIVQNSYLYGMTKLCPKTVLRNSLPLSHVICFVENHVNFAALSSQR